MQIVIKFQYWKQATIRQNHITYHSIDWFTSVIPMFAVYVCSVTKFSDWSELSYIIILKTIT